MQESEALSAVISDIYDTSLDPNSWPDALAKMAQFVGGQGASLLFRDAVSKSTRAPYIYGSTPNDARLYCEHYAELDPRAPLMYFFEVGQIVSRTDALPYEELIETRYHKEWAQPLGWVDSALVILEKSATHFTSVSFLRKQSVGRVDREMRRRVKLITPHLQRAAMIARRADVKDTQTDMFSHVFDRLSAAVFFVDARAQIVHANASGNALLADRSQLRVVNGKLVGDVAVDQALREVFLAARTGDKAEGVKVIAMRLATRNGDNYVASVMPLTSGARRRVGEQHGAVAVLFVQKAELQLRSGPEVIAKVYRLTPSELRVLIAIVKVGGVPETAGALGICETTVRTHLQRIFAKTETSRQADLVKLVAGFSLPFIA